MPYLNDELREWIAAHLATLGVEEIAIYAVDPQRGQDDERRVLVATEVGLIDGWYAPRGGSSARYGFTARIWPWQAVRGVDLRGETYRVWALEHRTRWWLRLARPAFESETDAPELGAALCDFAKVCAVMAEPAGWQAAQEEVPVRREGLRVLPEPTEVPPEAGSDVEAIAPTGRPAVPPPVVGPPLMASEPRPLRPDAAFTVAGPEPELIQEPEAEPDILIDEFVEPEAEEQPGEPAVAGAEPLVEPEEEGQRQTSEPGDDTAEDRAADVRQADERGGDDGTHPGAATLDGEEAPEPPAGTPREAEQPRHGLLTLRREARREREAREREEGAAQPDVQPDHPEVAAVTPLPAAATATLPPGEEPVDLNAYLPGEEPINLDEYDPDPLGLDGPLRDR
jgi:hypothetical protein